MTCTVDRGTERVGEGVVVGWVEVFWTGTTDCTVLVEVALVEVLVLVLEVEVTVLVELLEGVGWEKVIISSSPQMLCQRYTNRGG